MGTEIVFVLILPIIALCLPAAALLWSRVAKMEWETSSGPLSAYIPLLAGFAVSMLGLALYTYIECYADFTSLVQQGYYTEAERAVYLPGRAVGQATVELVVVLPAISFLVVPLTIWLIKRRRLTFRHWIVCYCRLDGVVAYWIDLLLREFSCLSISCFSGIYGDPRAALRIAYPCRGYLVLRPKSEA